jgi:hypothetical protein
MRARDNIVLIACQSGALYRPNLATETGFARLKTRGASSPAFSHMLGSRGMIHVTKLHISGVNCGDTVEGNFNRVWRTNVSQDDQGGELPTLDLMTRYGTQNDTTKVTVF